MRSKWTVTLEEDPDTGDLVMPLPPDLLNQVGWDFGDTLIWCPNEDGSFVISKKIDNSESQDV